MNYSCFFIYYIREVKTKCNYHLVAAFISKLCFSAQQWTNFTYHDQLININYVACLAAA